MKLIYLKVNEIGSYCLISESSCCYFLFSLFYFGVCDDNGFFLFFKLVGYRRF